MVFHQKPPMWFLKLSNELLKMQNSGRMFYSFSNFKYTSVVQCIQTTRGINAGFQVQMSAQFKLLQCYILQLKQFICHDLEWHTPYTHYSYNTLHISSSGCNKVVDISLRIPDSDVWRE